MRRIADLREEEIIAILGESSSGGRVVQSVGDDCAIVEKDKHDYYVITTDLLSEDIHFRRKTISPSDLGYKSLALNISDIAAMGALPVAAFLSISLPRDLEVEWLEQFSAGMQECSRQFLCPVVGGDTAANAGQVFISFTVLGEVSRGDVLRRETAAPGDDIWISGLPGLSHVAMLHLEGELQIPESNQPLIMDAHLKPEPHVETGRFLATNKLATACMDCSDGILRDLERLTNASGVGAEIESELIPLDRLSFLSPETALDAALNGGEDFYLLFTARPGSKEKLEAKSGLSRIGRITKEQGLVLITSSGERKPVSAKGFEHFS